MSEKQSNNQNDIKEIQMSESMIVGILLAVVGGFLDAYTYIARGGVFANAQTGNMVLMGIQISEGNVGRALRYLVPIVAFVAGVLIAECIKAKYKEAHVHWRQLIIAIEVVTLVVVALLPESQGSLANALVSFVCSLQVESFRKVKGNPFATTMCTGNLRSATDHLFQFMRSGDMKRLAKSMTYFTIILMFILGACIGTVLTRRFGMYTAIFAAGMLLIVLMLMSSRVHLAYNEKHKNIKNS